MSRQLAFSVCSLLSLPLLLFTLLTGCGGSGKKSQAAPVTPGPAEVVPAGGNLAAQGSDVRALLACADFDRDGRPDIASVNAGGEVTLFQNNGTPFTAELGVKNVVSTETGGANAIVAADLDRDGREDLIVGTAAANVVIFKNPAPGSNPFTSAWTRRAINNLPLDSAVNTLAAGDLNGDAFLDIVAGLGGNIRQEIVAFTSPRSLLFTTGTWAEGRSDIDANPDVRSLALADLDGDGDPDLVTGGSDRIVRVWRNTSGSFPAVSSAGGVLTIGSAGGQVLALAAADLDDDGFADVATAGADAGNRTLLVWENPGVGSNFTPFTVAAWSNGIGNPVSLFGLTVNALAAADLNNDSFPDLVVGASLSERAEVVAFTNDRSPFSGSWLQSDLGDTLDDVLAVAAADLDADGQADTVAGTRAEREDFEIIGLENAAQPGPFGILSPRADLVSSGAFNARAVSTADLDRDGDPDVLSGDEANRIVLVENSGDPFSRAGAQLVLDTANDDVIGLATADYDLDGDVDVVALLNQDGDQAIEDDRLVLYRSDATILAGGDGNPFDQASEWTPRNLSNSSLNFTSLASADFDRDGSPDLVTADDGGVAIGSVRVWKNPFPAAGAATQFWTANRVETDANPSEPLLVIAGDFDLDGDADVAAALAAGEIILFQNDGSPFDGTWPARTISAGGFGVPRSLALSDVDRDGDPDLAVGTSTSQIRLFQNPGPALAFAALWSQGLGIDPVPSPFIDSINGLAFIDVDRNGVIDLAVATGRLENFEVILLQNLNTPFTAGSWVIFDFALLFDSARALATADLNSDGKDDLILATNGEESFEVNAFRN
ncbi:MAG: VCBS repeat-containing protein [Planctomycetes bacterium]|nr:VCBS repeat-containing protein [Planctomycetota bacterium]